MGIAHQELSRVGIRPRLGRTRDYLRPQLTIVILSEAKDLEAKDLEAKDLEAKDLKSFSAKEILRFAQDDGQRPKGVLR